VRGKQLGVDWDNLRVKQGENLPHWACGSAVYHVSFRLTDSIPSDRRRQWLAERENILDAIAQLNREPSESELKRLCDLYSQRVEDLLNAGHGECLLARPEVGRMVASALEHFHEERYRLYAYCVMPNHVHGIVESLGDCELPQIVHNWKSFTANQANRMLHRKGAFWQHDWYDHIIRSASQLNFLMDYVWQNPHGLKAGFIRKRWD
jgi:REP element-mobilizing transposase RayT